MDILGLVLLLIGAALVAGEAHAPGGVLGVLGGIALMTGGIIVILALGGGAVLALPVGLALGVASVAWALLATRAVAGSKQGRIRAGSEALHGRVGVARRWSESAGQVFVDGALWRARHELHGIDDEAIKEGDAVVVERVSGLTLSVRRAEDWELIG
jgi:membrane protein implicated in regulation of membrane protease activity